MAAEGAFYWVNEADIVICSEDATFFDPHVSYGMTEALEPIGLARRIPLGETLRIALLGLDERLPPNARRRSAWSARCCRVSRCGTAPTNSLTSPPPSRPPLFRALSG